MTLFNLMDIAKRAGSVAEFISLARDSKIRLSEEDAQIYFDRWHSAEELTDDELEGVGGGTGQSFAGKVVCEYCLKGDKLSINMSSGGAYFCERCNCFCNGKAV